MPISARRVATILKIYQPEDNARLTSRLMSRILRLNRPPNAPENNTTRNGVRAIEYRWYNGCSSRIATVLHIYLFISKDFNAYSSVSS